MDAIVTRGLTKTYGTLHAVDQLDLTVHSGELLALLGVNGAGKTTVIKLLTGLIRPTAGDAWLCGKSICTQPRAAKAHLAVSPQETAVARNLTVQENLALMAGVYSLPGDAAAAQIRRLLRQFGLEPAARKRAGTLSGGWQRRLSIAMALVPEPDVLFLDEPTQGLDILARGELWDLIRGLKGRTTILLTTHDMEEAEALSDRVAVMQTGRLLAVDTASGLEARTGRETLGDAFVALVKEAE